MNNINLPDSFSDVRSNASKISEYFNDKIKELLNDPSIKNSIEYKRKKIENGYDGCHLFLTDQEIDYLIRKGGVFEGLRLSPNADVTFEGKDFSGCIFNNCIFTGINIGNISFFGAKFYDTKLENCVFYEESNFDETEIYSSLFSNVSFLRSSIQNAKWGGNNYLNNFHLNKCDISGSIFNDLTSGINFFDKSDIQNPVSVSDDSSKQFRCNNEEEFFNFELGKKNLYDQKAVFIFTNEDGTKVELPVLIRMSRKKQSLIFLESYDFGYGNYIEKDCIYILSNDGDGKNDFRDSINSAIEKNALKENETKKIIYFDVPFDESQLNFKFIRPLNIKSIGINFNKPFKDNFVEDYGKFVSDFFKEVR